MICARAYPSYLMALWSMPDSNRTRLDCALVSHYQFHAKHRQGRDICTCTMCVGVGKGQPHLQWTNSM